MKYVYLLRAGKEHYKVGIAANVSKRASAIQTGNPNKVEVITAKLVDNALKVEREIHQQLREMGADGGTEWFTLESEEALFIAAHINRNPDLDILLNIDLSKQVIEQMRRHKSLEKKLDLLINLHQSPAARARAGISKGEDVELDSKTVDAVQRSRYDVQRAMDVFKLEGRASTSLLQRKLNIGYGRASRIMDQLEKEGYVGPLDGANPRELLKQ